MANLTVTRPRRAPLVDREVTTDTGPTAGGDEASAEGHDSERRTGASRYERMVNSSQDLMALIDRDWVHVLCNPSYARAFGLTPSDMTGRSIQEVFGRENFEEVIRPHAEGCFAGREARFLRWVTFPAGGRRYLDFAYYPTHGEDGLVMGFGVIARDITERKLAEEALAESRERYRHLFQKGPVMLHSIDTDGIIVSVSDLWLDLLGYSRDEVVGKPSASFLTEESARHSREVVMPDFWRVGHCTEVPYQMVKKDGEVIDVLLSATSERDTVGRVARSVAVITDVTARNRAQMEQARLEEQVRRAQRLESVGRLAGGVAHDFNNMLSVILGHAELALEDTGPAQPSHADLQVIRDTAERSASLTRQLLAFARKQPLSPQILNLNDGAESALSMLRRLIGEDIELVWRPGAALWPARVDPTHVDQVLANLCVNARDAILGGGTVTIETKNMTLTGAPDAVIPDFVPGDYVRLEVRDDGCGMDAAILEHLYEPFFTTKSKGQGTGLGLATVYGIVKQNGGFIGVSSEPNAGTSFTIYFPRVDEETAAERAQQATKPPMGRGETILLVEDAPAILGVVQTMLERLGYKVLATESPREALRLAEVHADEVDLLLTDVVMPEMNGRELADTLTADRPDLHVLFVSGYTADVMENYGVREGIRVVSKPLSVLKLATTVRELLDGDAPAQPTTA